jgi:pseudaminic acid cytidylyltransferase
MTIRNTIAVIPARAGSKRIPHKNIRPFGGKPLIAYTIEAAKGCGLFERVVVSTDSEAIAEIARHCGAEAPFLRSAQLADDHTPASEVTVDALERLDPDGHRFAYVAQLMATCPLRDADDVRASFDHFQQLGADAQISLVGFGWTNPWWSVRLDDDGKMHTIFQDQLKVRSQDLPSLYALSGAIWWARTEVVRLERTFHVPGRVGHTLAWSHALDIDTDEDWQLGELLLGHRLQGCGSSS